MANSADFGVVYGVAGGSHIERLAVSLYSLRSVWSGPVAVIDGGGCGARLDSIVGAVGAQRIAVPCRATGNASYAWKGTLAGSFPFGVSLWLDADTTVHAPIEQIMEAGARAGLAVTQFARWETTGRIVSGRLRRWLRVSSPVMDVSATARRLMSERRPAVNTGIFALRSGHPFAEDWRSLSLALKTFIVDELACQLLLEKHAHEMLGHEWNWSPRFGDPSIKPKIIHYHGDRHARAGGRDLWDAVASSARLDNFAGMQSW